MSTDWEENTWAGRKAVRPLRVIIIGAGITGLSVGLALAQTGHTVTVLEKAPEIAEVGAGLQIAPNASRILRRLGILHDVMEHMSVLSRVSARRYDSDEEICSTPMMPNLEERYGAPMGAIHRGDLQRILLVAACQAGCQVMTSHSVTDVDTDYRPRIRVVDTRKGEGKWIKGDLIISADGVRSTVRSQMTRADGCFDTPVPTGDSAYRLLVPRETIADDHTLIAMLDENVAMRYLGPYGHIMAYPVKKNKLYNIVLLHPDKKTSTGEVEDTWTNKSKKEEMLDFYSKWSPTIQKWLALADEDVLDWPLNTHKPLSRWCRGSIALAGDACHPMLPYVAQGAANGIEDAGVLAAVFTCTSDMRLALGVYELVRKERAERIADSATSTGRVLHMPDGPEQKIRDEKMRAASAGLGSHEDKWQDRQWQDFMWATDVMRDTVEGWDILVKEIEDRGLERHSSSL